MILNTGMLVLLPQLIWHRVSSRELWLRLLLLLCLLRLLWGPHVDRHCLVATHHLTTLQTYRYSTSTIVQHIHIIQTKTKLETSDILISFRGLHQKKAGTLFFKSWHDDQPSCQDPKERFSGCVDPTSPNLAKTKGNHRYWRSLFQSSDILLHFQTQAAQSRVMLKMTPKFALFDPCEN